MWTYLVYLTDRKLIRIKRYKVNDQVIISNLWSGTHQVRCSISPSSCACTQFGFQIGVLAQLMIGYHSQGFNWIWELHRTSIKLKTLCDTAILEGQFSTTVKVTDSVLHGISILFPCI